MQNKVSKNENLNDTDRKIDADMLIDSNLNSINDAT